MKNLNDSERTILQALVIHKTMTLTWLRRAVQPMTGTTFNHNLEKLVQRKCVTCAPGGIATITSTGIQASAPSDLHALVYSL